jgi:hypothetical protein
MAGGLINVVSYSSNDLYLTGAPQITFFKMVYRRYTNFAMEAFYLDFDDYINFDKESELVTPRIADLVHKAYLHIHIPNIKITKHDVGIDTSNLNLNKNNKTTASTTFEKVKTVYMNVLTNIYRIISKASNAINVTYAGLVQDVQNYIGSSNIITILSEYDALLSETKNNLNNTDPRFDELTTLLDSTRSNLFYILTNIDRIKLIENSTKYIDINVFQPGSEEYMKELQRIMKFNVLCEIERGIAVCKKVQQYFFDESKKIDKKTIIDRDANIKCAWVKNLGHSIIEHIDVFIGGKRIDRHLGIWINIWYQLTYNTAQIRIYDHLIGNVEALTKFDSREKPCYDLYIPLSFWFNKFNGLSFPLIAMQYNDLRFNVKLRKLEEVFYIERIYKGNLNGNETVLTASMIDFIQNRNDNQDTLTNIEMIDCISLNDIWCQKGKRLNGHILMDYVYLGSLERRKFAQSGHEYLIEIMQYNVFDNVRQRDFDTRLDFTTPSKELVWVFLKDIYTENHHGWNECRWYDHATTIETIETHDCEELHDEENKRRRMRRISKGNPVVSAKMTFNNYTRIQRQVGKYFDKLQPLFYHRRSPTDGINLYSFCIDPLQHQPTGSCNFSKLSNVRLFCTLNPLLFRYTDEQIYPHDLDICFNLTITDPARLENLIESIDVEFAKRVINELKPSNNNNNFGPDYLPNYEALDLLESAKITLFVYEQLTCGKIIDVEMQKYRKVFFKTAARSFVFDLTMNILRLIGGYGALAYSGNN